MIKAKKIILEPFCHKQFDKKAGSLFIDFPMEEFTDRCDQFYKDHPDALKDGYAPFCKHLFIPNFTTAITGCIEITPENQQYLRSGYEARRENELAVLCQWLDISKFTPKKAEFLDIILYSRE